MLNRVKKTFLLLKKILIMVIIGRKRDKFHRREMAFPSLLFFGRAHKERCCQIISVPKKVEEHIEKMLLPAGLARNSSFSSTIFVIILRSKKREKEEKSVELYPYFFLSFSCEVEKEEERKSVSCSFLKETDTPH